MATLTVPDNGSDYSYDLSAEDEALLSQLVGDLASPPHHPSGRGFRANSSRKDCSESSVLSDLPPLKFDHESTLPVEPTTKPPRVVEDAVWNPTAPVVAISRPVPESVYSGSIVSYPDLSGPLSIFDSESTGKNTSEIDSNGFQDTRSPLVRFRSFPRKPFSVTDLTSGAAWCELQYYYTLTRLPGGRKTKTAIMKQGSKVHKDLEDQVHKTVRIDVTTKEDGFGLRLWNVIQGLRTLRTTGLTRELEVWGMIDGNLVTGIIDSLTYTSPNPNFELELSGQEEKTEPPKASAKAPSKAPPKAALKQPKMKDFLSATSPAKGIVEGPRVYLGDVKTRGSIRPPTSPVSLRPAKIQLFLYHRFLSDMILGKLDFLRVFRRLGLDPDDSFTDEFLAQIGSLHDEVFFDAESNGDTSRAPTAIAVDSSPTEVPESESSSPDLIKYHTLRELLPLLRSELQQTFPEGIDSLGQLLSIEYRYRGDGRCIGDRVFPMNDHALDLHLATDMAWWRGDRKPDGVPIEEAFKCRTCEFVEDCSWRKGLDEESLRRANAKVEGKKVATDQ